MPEYIPQFVPNASPDRIKQELSNCVEKEDWSRLVARFEQLWFTLPDHPAIRQGPFFDLCDLCSEYNGIDW